MPRLGPHATVRTVSGVANITGIERTDFYQEPIPVGAPSWTAYNATPSTVTNNATLTLKEKNGNRRISMAVGLTEALAIAQKRGQTQIPPDQQPQAYILMRDAIQQMGGRIDRVVVNDATQKEYLAQVVVSNNGDVKVS